MEGHIKFDEHLLTCIRQGDNQAAQTILKEVDPGGLIDHSGTSLLHVAAECGNLIITKYLISEGCKVNAMDAEGNTSIFLASQKNHVDVVLALLRAKADVLITNNQGTSAAKVLFSDMEVFYWILNILLKKIKVECANDSVLTAKELIKAGCPLARAVRLKDTAITKYMLENGCNVNEPYPDNPRFTPLHQSVIFNDFENVKLLVENGADVNAQDCSRRVPLNFAYDFTRRKRRILKFLLDKGARIVDDDGRLIAHEIFQYGKKETVMGLLAKYKLDLMAKEWYQQTPLLHFLAYNEDIDVIEILQSQNYDVNVEDMFGSTVLIHVLFTGNIKVVEFLLAKGASVNVIGRDYATPLNNVFFSVKIKYYSEKIGLKYIDLLLEYGADPQHRMDEGNRKTLFDTATIDKTFGLTKPILAHLALAEELGGEVKDFILQKINSHAMFRGYFDICKRAIEKMKRTTIQPGITVFQCLVVKRVNDVIKLSRNEKIVLELKSMMYYKRRSNVYYHKLLRKRVAKMIVMGNLRKKVWAIVSQIRELQMNSFVIGKIVDYIIYYDLKVIVETKNPNFSNQFLTTF